ncbi:hypothetical protein [Burkholderia stabilis]|uniref:hypothetical protein n=1 Tax=Burkholderia stabilis TaxID=95485 RepID=UPI0012EA06BA|nr:hypothetical protein [Burkholderia stabilis]HDR9495699.1 hypothetical protein [Burkholderia stabilis]HDR9525155.1 hypothetical protein [Burkholderia stabilis]HDR9532845.1 hypothetical protein [Burkholderia stabilis]HDR9539694.1 hypothetical protein [Burkholderia stabilis]HDR9548049.1 hypothetical protein [Burkholderia stabilis]
MRREIRPAAVSFLMVFAIATRATTPCPGDAKCEISIEDSVAIYAEMAAITQICAERDAVNASRYDLGLRKEVEFDSRADQERLNAVLKHPDLPRLIQDAYRAIVAEQGSSWRHDCEALLRSADAIKGGKSPN